MRLNICLSLLLSICLNSAAIAEDTKLDKSTLQSLELLEKRYFGHTFSSDTDESRAGRLEQLVFGDQSSGDIGERIGNLVNATPKEEAPSGTTDGVNNEKSQSNSGKGRAQKQEFSEQENKNGLNQENGL